MKVYYAHCENIYNTPQEKRDIETLEALGLEVVNPNGGIKIPDELRGHKNSSNLIMEFFKEEVKKCDALAFRSVPDGLITAGVMTEIQTMRDAKKPVIELPSMIAQRSMSIEETREYLHEIGQR